MKKVFLAVLCAGLFFACGNKKQAEQPETLVDTPVVEQTVAEITEEAEPVAEEPVAEAAPAKKTATPAKKTTNNNNSGMTAGKTNEAPLIRLPTPLSTKLRKKPPMLSSTAVKRKDNLF